jgi:hypothetical protein
MQASNTRGFKAPFEGGKAAINILQDLVHVEEHSWYPAARSQAAADCLLPEVEPLLCCHFMVRACNTPLHPLQHRCPWLAAEFHTQQLGIGVGGADKRMSCTPERSIPCFADFFELWARLMEFLMGSLSTNKQTISWACCFHKLRKSPIRGSFNTQG